MNGTGPPVCGRRAWVCGELNVNLVTRGACRIVWAMSLPCALLVGCGPEMPTPDQLARFQAAGPVQVSVDAEALIRAKIPTSSYRVVSGDLLSIQVSPAIRSDVDANAVDQAPLLRRVDAEGRIDLPLVKEVGVGGKTIPEIEALIVAKYCPDVIVNRPSVVVQVAEYSTRYVEIVGAVGSPGVHQLRSDELTLVSLLLKAGNIQSTGAAAIRITSPGDKEAKTLSLPVKGLTTAFADVPLSGGEVVEVERLSPQTFTVLGLIRNPGTYAYPLDARMNLVSVLGMAGGPDALGDPRYVTVYRQDKDGQIVSAKFQLNGDTSGWTEASLLADSTLGASAFTPIKPGDVVFLEKDARTRTRTVLSRIIQVNVGASAFGRTEATYYKDYSSTGGDRTRQ